MVTIILGAPSRAGAEPSADDKSLATILFREGRALMATGSIHEACQKLEESERLDPSGGTILNLALCHERDGRFACAWSEFSEAATVARREGRQDREVEATGHVRGLEPRLSRLTIVVPAGTQVEGLRIERDGRELVPAAWSIAIPVDGGEHVVHATALGREPFITKIIVGNESDLQTVEIPVLATPVVVVGPPRVSAPMASTGVPAAAGSVSAAAAEAPMTPATAARLRRIGIGATGVGVVALGVAGYLLKSALSAKDASNADCTGNECGSTGRQKRSDAVSRGNWATLLSISGVALVGTGATLFYFGRRSPVARSSKGEPRVALRWVFEAAPGAVVTTIKGGF